jgi:hypothetical protein
MPKVPRRLWTGLLATLLGAGVSLLGAGAPAFGSSSTVAAWTLLPVANTGTVNGLSGLSPNDVWAVGYFYDQPQGRYRPLTQHWDGTKSTYIQAPTATRGYNAFNAVVEVAPNDVWAVGYHTPVYYTYEDSPLVEHYDGSKWRIVAAPYRGSGTLTDIAAAGPNDVWAVGYRTVNPYGTLIEHWDGVRWSLLDDGHSRDNSQFWSVVAKGSNDIWAAGSTVHGTRVIAFAEHWNGSSWTESVAQPGRDYDVFNAIADDFAGGLWGVGWETPGLGYYQMGQRFDGSRWSMTALPDVGSPNNNLYGLASAGDQAWAVGYATGVPRPLIEHWDGAQWSIEPNPGRPGAVLYTAQHVGPQIWVAGDGMIMFRTI